MQHDPLLHLVKFNILFIFLSMTKNRLASLPSAVVLLSKGNTSIWGNPRKIGISCPYETSISSFKQNKQIIYAGSYRRSPFTIVL